MIKEKNTQTPDRRAKPGDTVKPHENPGPRGNPEIEYDALKRGIEKLERV